MKVYKTKKTQLRNLQKGQLFWFNSFLVGDKKCSKTYIGDGWYYETRTRQKYDGNDVEFVYIRSKEI